MDMLERKLPYDIESEKALIGSIMLSTEAFDLVRGIVREEDFFDQSNAVLYRTMLGMVDVGEAIDVVLLVNRLKASGCYETVGGSAYIFKTSQAVPNPDHAVYYARIVADKAKLRGIIAASTETLRDAYDETEASTEILSRAEDRLFTLRDDRTIKQARPIHEILHDTLDQIDRGIRGEETVAIATGFTDLDRILAGGFRPGELIIVAARPSMGKAQPLGSHHVLPIVQPVEFVDIGHRKIDPYLLGLLLGDGSFRANCVTFCKPEADIQNEVVKRLPESDTASFDGQTLRIRRKQRNNERSDTGQAIIEMGLDGLISCEKFIPDNYIYAPVDVRLALLRGLLDTDGSVVGGNSLIEFSTTSKRLGDGVEFIAKSLGAIVSRVQRVTQFTHNGETKDGLQSERIRISFPNGIVPVSSQKHLAKWSSQKPRHYRSIVSIEPAGSQPCQCIVIDSKTGLYVTDEFIVTHNSSLAADFTCSIATDRSVAFFSLEMTDTNLCERMLSAIGQVDGIRLRNRMINETERTRLTEAAGNLSQRHICIDDNSHMRVGDIAASLRTIEQRAGRRVEMIVVDYLQFVTPDDLKLTREQQVANIGRRLKTLAKENQIPVVAVCAVSRKNEDGSDKRPKLSMLRESGSLEFEADIVLGIHREDYYRRGEERREVEGLAEVLILKQRNGPTGEIELRWDAAHTRFQNLAPERLQQFEDYTEQAGLF
jgi:replicative DNA helicase